MSRVRLGSRSALMVLALGAGWFEPGSAAAQLANTPALKKCDAAAFAALKSCFAAASSRLRKCYRDTGAPCTSGDIPMGRALDKVDTKITMGCGGVASLAALGYGPTMDRPALTQRLRTACLDEAQSLASRTYGGPQGAVLAAATPEAETCLDTGFKEGAKLIKKSLVLQSACVRKEHKGHTCDLVTLETKLGQKRGDALDKLTFDCTLTPIKDLLGLTENLFLDRATAQSRCMVATAHADVATLDLDCGPRDAVPVPPRGVWTQVVLSEAEWGTRCGAGGPYAFWIRLAPMGSPVEKVIVDLQGGGVCVLEGDCSAVASGSPGLFEALNDYQPAGPTSGYLSTNPVDNPFSDWTMIALPYCTQDVHIGGGVDSVFPSVTVSRYGAVDVRATLRYLRDVLWNELDATTTAGYRPDILRVIFGGVSAGGFGVSYNLHYLLDDLRWNHVLAVPDSAMALDNGMTYGVRTLGFILTGDPPNGWATRPFQPPYALSGDFAVVPELQAATSVRLKVPDQEILNLSNQADSTQVGTTFFSSQAAWTNAARAAYCTNQGLNGLYYFLSAQTTPLHGILQSTSRFNTLTADGVSVRTWLDDAVTNPAAVVDRVEEGTMVADYPGVLPFSCDID